MNFFHWFNLVFGAALALFGALVRDLVLISVGYGAVVIGMLAAIDDKLDELR